MAAEAMRITVDSGCTVGEYVDQLTGYLTNPTGGMYASMIADIWVANASGHALPNDVAETVAALALTAYAHRRC